MKCHNCRRTHDRLITETPKIGNMLSALGKLERAEAKQRDGPIGTARLRFQGPHTRLR
jgi:hypothetical protein